MQRLANALRGAGVKKGDRVTLFMPMVPQLALAMLACARIGAGNPQPPASPLRRARARLPPQPASPASRPPPAGAVHTVVFGGFSAEALASRIEDAASRVVITADGVMRGRPAVNGLSSHLQL